MRSRIAVLLAIPLATAVIAACGEGSGHSDETRAVARTITSYLSAVARGDGAAACSQLTENAQLGVFEFRFAHIGTDHPDRACARVVERSRLRGNTALRTAQVSEIKIEGESARASVGGTAVTLERVGGHWKINEFGLAGRLLGQGPPSELTLR